jgi:bifunctional oligoribonuclease and PAP phosphatase NrnA
VIAIVNSSNFMEEQRTQLIEKILSCKTAVVTAHINPDGDTLASMLALTRILKQLDYDTVHSLMHDRVPEIYEFFPDSKLVLSVQKENDKKQLLDSYDISFSCDCGSIARLGLAGEVWSRAKFTCNVDHHASNPLYADLNWVDPEATCTGEVIEQICLEINKKSHRKINIDKDTASLLYITLLTDTGGFRHSNTNEKSLKWAAELVSKGANPSYLYNHLFNKIPSRAIRVIGDALNKVEIIENKFYKIAYSTSTRAFLDSLGADDEDTDEIVDHLMRIKEIDLCIYLREGKKAGSIKGSLRSSSDKLDCSKIATQVNGGGHSRAAGFNIENDNFENTKKRILDLILQNWQMS